MADHVGEIDTAAPIESVKAAVSLFGDVGSAKIRPVTRRSSSDERVLEKETQHHMKLRELDYYKDQLKTSQIAKARAQKDLQRANRTLQQLTNRLQTLGEQQQASILAAEAAKIRAQELEAQKARRAHLGPDAWKVDLESERESYRVCMSQLAVCKKELDDLKAEFNEAMEQKIAVFQKAEEAQQKAHMDQERQKEVENEVKTLRQMLGKIQISSDDQSRIVAEKENQLRARMLAKEEAEREIKRLKDEYEPAEDLQEKLLETTVAVKILEEQVKELHSSDIYALKTTFSELEKSKKSLEESLEEEKTLKSSIDSIKQELEEVKIECSELERKALEAESYGDQIQVELEKRKTELDAAMSECASTMKLSVDKLLSEAELAIREAEESNEKAEVLQKETEALRLATEEAEEKLKTAIEESEAAKKVADDMVYNYSGPTKEIRLSAEEFESMKNKIEEFRSDADAKVATAMAEKESIATREKDISQKLEGLLEENEAIETEIEDAMKRAEMAEAARKMVEGELQKWRQN